ncbi:MAG: glutamine amidotransferase [Bifidobacteriaceae bacterium]|jgi:GMP synthase (glutamine-hydrolysing)|nr:glutamine amidotransferase [Bifidobacteriaceae bacterium]
MTAQPQSQPQSKPQSLTALAVRHVAFEDLGALEPILRAGGYQVDFLEAGLAPITPAVALAPDLLVVLGGPIGVYETAAYPFLAAEREGIAARLEARRPTLGICLGAQLMAAALGAEVAATGRKEIGYGRLSLTEAGRRSALGPLDGLAVLHWHGDQFAIPPGAEHLAATPGFPNQAFALGSWALGLQFHIEAEPARLEQWLIGHACELAGAQIAPDGIRRDAARFGPPLSDAARQVFAAWLAGLPQT